MIPKLTASTIYSTLGNNSSKVPLAIKDIANSCGLTAASYMSGDNAEGKDRFIDEFGTQAIWLWGIPAYKKGLDIVMYKPVKIDPEVDVRILKNQEILKAAKEFAPTKEILASLEKVASHQKLAKNLNIAKFALSTALTAASYLGLTKFRHNYTEKQIKKEIAEKQKNGRGIFARKPSANIQFSSAFSAVHNNLHNKKNVAFTGGVQDFVFDPVKNLMIVDGIITGERLSHSKNPQDFFGYVIKEGSFWAFMYLAGPLIAKAMEKAADKKGKSIDLDARVIFGEQLKNSIQDGSLKSHLEAFKAADVSDVDIYKFAVNPKTKNLVVDMAKTSDIISQVKDSELVDTRKYVDLGALRGVHSKLEKLLTQYENSGSTVDEFLKSVRKMKKGAVLKNIGSCIGALGLLAPVIMLVTRKFGTGADYQVRKDIEDKMSANK
ncbi:MAG: hypothetical protein NC191_10165 [Muribaculaceae bacterium]|nr:hypothetical protein [Muribaculaceae bacterium]